MYPVNYFQNIPPYINTYYGQQHSFNGSYHRGYPPYPYSYDYFRQQTISGQATWTEGGQVTKCGIPWSNNRYMTVAVGEDAPYQCGETLKIANPETGREALVTVVDEVSGYQPNRINLHRRAFEVLGATPEQGVINVQITPTPELEEQKWGKYLLEITQTAYPAYNVTDYQFVEETQVSPEQTKETYEYRLQSPQEQLTVRANVIYNPNTNRIVSFDISEV